MRMYELAGANDDDRQDFYRYAEQKSVVCVRNTVLQEFTRTTHTTHERIKMPVCVIVKTFLYIIATCRIRAISSGMSACIFSTFLFL